MKPSKHLHWVFLLWTFPGVVIHELAHRELCRYYQIPVKEVCYFQLDNPPGYVVHARPRRYLPSFMISIAPVFVNTGIAFLGGVIFAWLVLPFEGILSIPGYPPENLVGGFLAAWIGVASGIHALPSRQDAKEVWWQTRRNWYNPFVLAVIPAVLIVEVLNRLRPLHIPTIAGVLVFLFGVVTWTNSELILQLFSDPFWVEEIELPS